MIGSDNYPQDHYMSESEFVEMLIHNGLCSDSMDSDGNTPLHLVVNANMSTEMCQQVISAAPLIINKPNFSGETPLSNALTRGHVNLSQLLFQCGAIMPSIGPPAIDEL